jgi:hypothetical protein
MKPSDPPISRRFITECQSSCMKAIFSRWFGCGETHRIWVLHIQSAPAFAAPGDAPPAKWGVATTFLRSKDVISQKDEAFITSLYTLISDEAIHPLIAPREYCRLFRNIVIEYGVLFLTTLQNKGVTVKAAAKP